jgi:hypothetical protein
MPLEIPYNTQRRTQEKKGSEYVTGELLILLLRINIIYSVR